MNTQPKYWRNIAELENAPEFEEFLQKEFPDAAMTPPGSTSRRRFMQLMGASFALAGASSCKQVAEAEKLVRWQKEEILPYARRPEGLEPGSIRYFATGMELNGAMQALQVASYDNRPYKIEPNPAHPYSKGGTDAYAQASMLGLFDPDRSDTVLNKNAASTAEAFATFARTHFAGSGLKSKGGEGLRILMGTSSSPSVQAMCQRIQAQMPKAKFVQWESLTRDNVMLGAKMAFGAAHRTHLHLDRANIIVSLDDDMFGTHPARLKMARDWAKNRRPENGDMNRMYVMESRYTSTGAAADHRLPLRAEQIKAFAIALESAVKAKMGQGTVDKKGFLANGKAAKYLDAIAADLVANKGKGVVTAGHNQPPEVHAIAHRLNAITGNAGVTATYTATADREAAPAQFKGLVDEMAAGKVGTLLILGGNPVYDAPGDVDFKGALGKVANTLHVGLYVDETAKLCSWHVPMTHFLETWSDGRTWDGTVTVGQPMITPLFNGSSQLQVLAMVAGDYKSKPLDLVKGTLAGLVAAKPAAVVVDEGAVAPAAVEAPADAEAPAEDVDPMLAEARSAAAAFKAGFDWRKVVHQGFIEGTAFPEASPSVTNFTFKAPEARAYKAGKDLANGELEVVFYDDGKVFDGRFANNGWLQETPDFMTKLTWDNAAVMSPATATKLGFEDTDLIDVTVGTNKVQLAVYVLPGQPTGSVAMAVGYGRKAAGVVGGYITEGFEEVGFDVQPLRSVNSLYTAVGAQLSKAGGKYRLATTQVHNVIDTAGAEAIQKRIPVLVRSGNVADLKADPKLIRKTDHLQKDDLYSLFEERNWSDAANQWGMSIDLGSCIGCNACVVSCTSENNVSIVGKHEVLKGREMHWLRIDRYFAGDPEDPVVAHMPMACAHCDNAPCEQVCPVAATTHSAEGTNDMVYNRCIGTRYCANNCPYKVRRFNFHAYNQDLKEPKNAKKLMIFNPEVTVRMRGVMEKCSYCTQRIHYAKRQAKIENRDLKDGDIVAACQSACPTDAIVFGDLKDKNSRVRKEQELGRSYAVLSELNIKPRTQFLAKIKNPNPALVEA